MEEKGFLEEPTWAACAVRVERRLLSPHEPQNRQQVYVNSDRTIVLNNGRVRLLKSSKHLNSFSDRSTDLAFVRR